MITLYQRNAIDTIDTILYTFSNKEAGLSIDSWDYSIQEAVDNYTSNTVIQDHSTFVKDHGYTILGTFDSLSPTFMEDHPELFI